MSFFYVFTTTTKKAKKEEGPAPRDDSLATFEVLDSWMTVPITSLSIDFGFNPVRFKRPNKAKRPKSCAIKL